MEPGVTSASPKPRLIILALALTLAVIGSVGAVTGAADKSGNISAASGSTTTSGELDTDDTTTTSMTGVTTPSTSLTTLKGGATATTRVRGGATTATTAVDAKSCEGTPTTSAPGGINAPPVGTFTYEVCGSGEPAYNHTVTAVSSSGGVTRRTIERKTSLGNQSGLTAFGPNGVVLESAKIQAQGRQLDCDWNPDIVEYPAALSVGKEWAVDSSCDVQVGAQKAKIRVQGTRKVTGIVQYLIDAALVSAWVVSEHQVVTFPGGTYTVDGVHFFDPAHGLALYEKVTSEATGFFTQPKTTVEVRLKSLTPQV